MGAKHERGKKRHEESISGYQSTEKNASAVLQSASFDHSDSRDFSCMALQQCFQAVFPFIHTNSNIIERACYYYVEDIPGGIFFIAPICFFSFYLIKFIKKTDKKELKSLVISLISVRITTCNIC